MSATASSSSNSSSTRVFPALRVNTALSSSSLKATSGRSHAAHGSSWSGSAGSGGGDETSQGDRSRACSSTWRLSAFSAPGPATPRLSPRSGVSAGSCSSLERLPLLQEWEFTTSTFAHKAVEHQDGADRHYIITGRSGILTRCEDEPIRTPGAIQAFGCLLALDEQADGSLRAQQVSENSASIIGVSPRELLSADTLPFTEQIDDIAEALAQHDSAGQPRPTPFTASFPDHAGIKRECSCSIHRPSPFERPRRVVLEVEPPYLERSSSFEIKPRPCSLLHEMQRYNKRRQRGLKAELDSMSLITEVQILLGRPTEVVDLYDTIVQIFKQVTGFDRVMLYEFDESWNGHVQAEEGGGGPTDYRGLVWPASDIPAQARELYHINRTRLLYDRDQPTARLCCRNQEEVDSPLDMTHSHLRAMSPIHIKYLGNMGVRSSMSISITVFSKLHALVACHTYEEPRRPSPKLRDLCTAIADIANVNLERLLLKAKVEGRQVISPELPSDSVVASPSDLLEIMQADFACLSIGGSNKLIGNIEKAAELLAVIKYPRRGDFNSVISTHHLKADFPDLVADFSQDFAEVAGFLAIPLSHRFADLICFFRRCQTKVINWAGNPQATKAGPLEPRTSFKAWREEIKGQSKQWTEGNLEEGGRIGFCYGGLIRLARESQRQGDRNETTRLLLGNAAHSARTPLNSIINNLELALEGDLSPDLRSLITSSRTASKSLAFVVEDLLDITSGADESGPNSPTIAEERFDLGELLAEAVQLHQDEAKRKGLSFQLGPLDATSQLAQVIGDASQVRKVVSLVAENAVKFTRVGGVDIKYGHREREMVEGDEVEEHDNRVDVAIKITDTGVGMSQHALEGIFRQLEGVGDWAPGVSVGLGLAVTSRIVRLLGGEIRVSSSPEGTEFTLILPLRVIGGITPTEPPRAPSPPSDNLERIVSAITRNHLAPDTSTSRAQGSGTVTRRPRPTPLASTSLYRPRLTTSDLPRSSPDAPDSPKPSRAALSRSPSSPLPFQQPATGETCREDSSLRVLVVEDDPLNRSIFRRLLERDGHQVEVCEHGGQALQVLETDRAFDLVLMDMQMPYMDGVAATKAIRALEEQLPTPLNDRTTTRLNGRLIVVCCSAQLEPDSLPVITDAGFDGFITKPVYLETLRSLLAGVSDPQKKEKLSLSEIGSRSRRNKWCYAGWLNDSSARLLTR